LHLLDFVAGFDAGHGQKPQPGMALAFAHAIAQPAAHIAVVGDTVADLQMGRAAGAGACIGVLSGISDRARLEPWADLVIDDIAALEAVLT
jgi:phosphoglycolate phosphatase